MVKYVIVADDLTGSNATCSLLKKVGLRAASIFQLPKKRVEEMDVISYSTDSRGITKEEAYERVKRAVNVLKGDEVLLYNKRIDSTLRGNIGAEMDAMLEQLEEDRIAVVVPAYPDSGRIVVNKIMLVNGTLLENSDAGRDPKTPIHTSCVEELIKKQTKYTSHYFNLETIAKEEKSLLREIQEQGKKNRILIFDAVTNEDIIKIARVVSQSDFKIITVDPGPFTMYYAKELQKKNHLDKKILMVIGSATETTKKQIEYILQQEDIFLEKMNPKNFFLEKERKQEIQRVVSMMKKGIESYDLFLLTTSPIGNDEKLNLQEIANEMKMTIEEISKIISNTLTEAAALVLEETQKFEGIYSSGGDITVALLEKLETIGVEIKEEVIPLTAYGRFIEGKFPNMKLVSKGGMVGREDTIKLCLNQMKNDI